MKPYLVGGFALLFCGLSFAAEPTPVGALSRHGGIVLYNESGADGGTEWRSDHITLGEFDRYGKKLPGWLTLVVHGLGKKTDYTVKARIDCGDNPYGFYFVSPSSQQRVPMFNSRLPKPLLTNAKKLFCPKL